MAVSYTSLLGLALPSTGEWVGTWGTNQNSYITEYLDAAIAGAQVISGSQTAVTLSTANGTSLSQAGTGATGSAQYAVIRCTGNPASLLTITAPATSKSYIIINATSTSQNVKIVAAGPTTGVTVGPGKTVIVVWNGSDFVTAASPIINLATDVTGVLPTANGGTGLSTFVANQVFYPSSSSVVAQSANLTFDGSTLTVNGILVGRGGGGFSSNTVFGNGALTTNTAGVQNTAIGFAALAANTASQNTAVGWQSLTANTTALGNTAVGAQAAAANTTGDYVTALGFQALYNSISGTEQTAVGYQSMYYMRGSDNTAVGMQAMRGSSTPANNTGTGNTAVGAYALYNIDASSGQTAIGQEAMGRMRGSFNTGIGTWAVRGSATPANNTGVNNVGVGYAALQELTSGTQNTAIGYQALSSITTGSNNTGVGNNSGNLITTGSRNSILGGYNGNQGGLDIRTSNDFVVLSDGLGNPRAYWNSANATFNGGLTLTAYLRTAVATIASSSTITPPSNDCNQYNVTALAVPATIAAPSGTPADGQKLLLRIKDDGTARALTWNAIYRVIGTILPTTTVSTKTTYVGCVYNSADVVWDVVAVTTQV